MAARICERASQPERGGRVPTAGSGQRERREFPQNSRRIPGPCPPAAEFGDKRQRRTRRRGTADGDGRQGRQAEGDRSALLGRGDAGPAPGGDTGPPAPGGDTRPLPGAAARLGRDGDTGQGRPLPGQGGIPEDPTQVRDHLPAAPRARAGEGRLSPPRPQPQPARPQRHLPARRAQRALRVHGQQGGRADGGAAPGRTRPPARQGHHPGPGHGPSPRDAHAAGRGALRGGRAGIRLGAERLARLRLTPNPTPRLRGGGAPKNLQSSGTVPPKTDRKGPTAPAATTSLSLPPPLRPHPAAPPRGGLWGNCASSLFGGVGNFFPLLFFLGGEDFFPLFFFFLPVECGAGPRSPLWLTPPQPCPCAAASASFLGWFFSGFFFQIFPGFFFPSFPVFFVFFLVVQGPGAVSGGFMCLYIYIYIYKYKDILHARGRG